MIYRFLACLFIFSNYTFARSTKVICSNEYSTTEAIVLYIFTGSDWCVNCKRFEKKVLNDSVFLKAIADNHVKIKILDFPQRKKLSPETISYNQGISEEFGFNGTFPTLVLSSKSSKKFKTFYYNNENGTAFSKIVLNELKKLNE